MGFNSGFKGLSCHFQKSNNFITPATSYVHFKSTNQPDATISQVYYLTSTRIYSSTCFGRPHARNMLSCT